MSRHLRRLSLPCLVVLASCASHTGDTTGSIGELRHTSADLTDVKIDGSTDLAIQSYREFLERTPEGGMTPEALRRLADLKIQKEYGTLEGVKRNQEKAARREASSAPTDSTLGLAAGATLPSPRPPQPELPKPAAGAKLLEQRPTPKAELLAQAGKKTRRRRTPRTRPRPRNRAATSRRARRKPMPSSPRPRRPSPHRTARRSSCKAKRARRSRCTRSCSRSTRTTSATTRCSTSSRAPTTSSGMTDKAMGVMRRIVKEYPKSRYFDEVQFRIGEYYFTRRKWLDAEEGLQVHRRHGRRLVVLRARALQARLDLLQAGHVRGGAAPLHGPARPQDQDRLRLRQAEGQAGAPARRGHLSRHQPRRSPTWADRRRSTRTSTSSASAATRSTSTATWPSTTSTSFATTTPRSPTRPS